MVKKLLALVLIIAIGSTFSGCYFMDKVSGQEVGLAMSDGVSISSVVSPGRYTNLFPFSRLVKIDISTKTAVWTDSDVWTKDKQVVTFGVSVSYSRKSDSSSIKEMWGTYNLEALNDEALDKLVMSRLPRTAKQITTQYTLDQMLGIDEGSSKNRDTLQKDIYDTLRDVLAECSIELIDIGINNIGVDDLYAAKLKEKSTAAIDVELAKERTKQLAEQVKQEEAKTEVEMEIARRNNLVAEEEAKVYALSPEAYELRRLELLKDILGDSDKVYFIPEGADISLYLAGNANGVPIIKDNG